MKHDTVKTTVISNKKTSAYTIKCLNVTETYTDIDKLIYEWGKEEVSNYYMLNTREMIINIA